MNKDEALFLPNGSVRAIAMLLLVIGCIASWLIRGEVPPALLTLTSGAVAYYFSANQAADAQKKEGTNP